MGILFDKVMEHKRRLALQDLRRLNINISQSGIPIEKLNYDELTEELLLATMRRGDVEADAEKWF